MPALFQSKRLPQPISFWFATSSPTPILEGRWLKPDALVIAVGAIGPHLRELDDEAMLSSCVIAEARSPVESESGDVRLSGARAHAEIGQVLSGAAQVPDGTRIVFKSVGMAIEDLVAARLCGKRGMANIIAPEQVEPPG